MGGDLCKYFISDFKTHFSIFRTKTPVAIAFFFFIFIAFTIFFVFIPPSNPSSPLSSHHHSYTPHISSLSLHLFPNSKPTSKLEDHTKNVDKTHKDHTFKAKNSKPSSNLEDHTKNVDKTYKDQTFKAKNSKPSSNLEDHTKNVDETHKDQTFRAKNCSSKAVNSSVSGEKGIAGIGGVKNLSFNLIKKQRIGENDAEKLNQGFDDLRKSLLHCDFYDGNWVKDESYPLYNPNSCSLIDEQFNCFFNGRPDGAYYKLKWKPKRCTLPRLNGSHMLEMLRGKRLVFVGDSLNRNMWESLICILKNSIKNQKKVYEASGKHQFRSEVSYSFVFQDYQLTVEFFATPFLVQEWEVFDKNGIKKETLRLDLISKFSNEYKDADIIVYNTGHWWTHDKTSKGKEYYQEGRHVYEELNVGEAFRKAMTTWGRWVDSKVDRRKSLVLFRGYSASHFGGGQWNSGGQCDNETEPITNDAYLSQYPTTMGILEQVIRRMKTRVSYMNVTKMTDYRKDGHPSTYRKHHSFDLMVQDCSHWCLPGVPDIWNEILYAELLVKLDIRREM